MKKTFATIALTLTVLFGATFANAGILVTDNKDTGCTIDPVNAIIGILVTDYAGGVQCTDRTGILVTD